MQPSNLLQLSTNRIDIQQITAMFQQQHEKIQPASLASQISMQQQVAHAHLQQVLAENEAQVPFVDRVTNLL